MESSETSNGNENEKFSKYWTAVKENPSDFTSWTCLLQTVDQENMLEEGREVYEEFFRWYPYCYGYWKKYSDLEKKSGFLDRTESVFKAGVKAIPLSIDLWIHYLHFMSQNVNEKPDNQDTMRLLFEEAIEAAGMEFRSDKLWDAYIDWEKSQGNLKNIVKIYDRLLSTPTQHYTKHFSKFKQWVENNKPSEILTTEDYMKLLGEVESIPPGVNISADEAAQDEVESAKPPGEDDSASGETKEESGDSNITDVEEAANVGTNPDEHQQTKENIDDSETNAVRAKIISLREAIHQQNEEEVKKRWHFEDSIKRPYFHVKPLERMQLRNWREYLDFEMKENNHKQICVLFERCLIACALYEEFWQKYVAYLETVEDVQGGVFDAIHSAYQRACTIHLTKKPNIILNWAAFEESQKNFEKAREILKTLDESLPGMIMVTLRRTGLERRSGNPEEGIKILKEEMEKASSADEKSFFAVKCAKYYAKFLHDKQSAKEVLHKAIEYDKGNKKLYLSLLDYEVNEDNLNEEKLEELCSIVEGSQDLPIDFKQGFFQRKLEILEDFGSDVHKIMEAFDTYQKTYKVKPGIFAGKRRANDSSTENQRMKIQKATESHNMTNAPSNQTYSNSTYAVQDSSSSTAANAYGYAAVSNPWGAYAAAAQNAGGYYGWYNPYGAYPQPQAQ